MLSVFFSSAWKHYEKIHLNKEATTKRCWSRWIVKLKKEHGGERVRRWEETWAEIRGEVGSELYEILTEQNYYFWKVSGVQIIHSESIVLNIH